MMAKRSKQKNVWLDIEFADSLREIARIKSLRDKRDYGCGDISKMMLKSPKFKELKQSLLEGDEEIIAQIRFKMDRRNLL